MKLFFHSLIFASIATFSFPQPLAAIEIERAIYCSVTVETNEKQFTIFVVRANLPKILKQLDVISFNCGDDTPTQPLF